MNAKDLLIYPIFLHAVSRFLISLQYIPQILYLNKKLSLVKKNTRNLTKQYITRINREKL